MAGFSLLSAAARRLEGKVAIITGGASGIGEYTAKLFSRHGAKVIIADIQHHSLPKELGIENSAAEFIHCDVTKETDVKNVVDFAISKHGKLDIMFNNAGIAGYSNNLSIMEAEKAQFEEVMGVNLVGPFLGTKHAARVMIPAQQGSIINTASTSSVIGGGASHAYTASKHAVVGLTTNMAVELGHYGIRVNCISPYFTATPMVKRALNIDEEEFHKLYSSLKGSVCRTKDVAEAAVYLGSDESKFVSGHNLILDGGFSITNVGFCVFN